MNDDKDPLEAEARRRPEWRGEDTAPAPEGGTGVPASEAGEARLSPAGDDGDGRPGKGGPGTIPPPD